MNELQVLMNDISDWSDETFGEIQRNPAILHHLKKEVDELIEAFENHEKVRYDASIGVGEFSRSLNNLSMEYADCFILLLDSAAKHSIHAAQFIALAREKLEINKKRKWGEPDENGVVEHIKDSNAESITNFVCNAPVSYFPCNVNDNGKCMLPTHCDYKRKLMEKLPKTYLVKAIWEDNKKCSNCDGTGSIEQKVYHNQYETVVCPKCNGFGRLEVKIVKRVSLIDALKDLGY